MPNSPLNLDSLVAAMEQFNAAMRRMASCGDTTRDAVLAIVNLLHNGVVTPNEARALMARNGVREFSVTGHQDRIDVTTIGGEHREFIPARVEYEVEYRTANYSDRVRIPAPPVTADIPLRPEPVSLHRAEVSRHELRREERRARRVESERLASENDEQRRRNLPSFDEGGPDDEDRQFM